MKDFPDIYNMHSAYILFLDYNNLQEFEWRRVNMATFDANKLKKNIMIGTTKNERFLICQTM